MRLKKGQTSAFSYIKNGLHEVGKFVIVQSSNFDQALESSDSNLGYGGLSCFTDHSKDDGPFRLVDCISFVFQLCGGAVPRSQSLSLQTPRH